jgi:DNA-binding IclR family transcriptional regulator
MPERRSTNRNETPAATVGRVTALLDAFAAAEDELGVTDLAERLRLAKSVVHRLVTALSAAGYLAQNPATRRYALGPRAARLGQAAVGNRDIRTRARPHLVRLATKTGETATLSIIVGESRAYAEQVESTQSVRQTVQIGSAAPLYVGASGKAILAYLPQQQRDAIIARISKSAPLLANGARLNVSSLKRDLETIRRRGFAISEAERIVGASSAAAPVFDHNGDVTGAISVASVTVRHGKSDLLGFGELARQYADRLSSELGSNSRALEQRGA